MTIPPVIPSTADIETHLSRCDSTFIPPLSSRVVLSEYAKKLHDKAELFHVWEGTFLAGLVAAYHNREANTFFITNVSVIPEMKRKGIASSLLHACIQEALKRKIDTITLEVDESNHQALAFYRANAFKIDKRTGNTLRMILTLENDR